MKRFKRPRRRAYWLHDIAVFCRKNGQLLFFTMLVLLGVIGGCATYGLLTEDKRQLLTSGLSYTIAPVDFKSGCVAVVSSAFSVSLLLLVLFLLGLTAYGVPLIILIPIVFGFWIGTMECRLYDSGGISAIAIDLLPHTLLSATAILIACAQSLRMSCVFSKQLLPSCAHCGGMWQDFKLYILRFLFCFMLAFAAAVCKVLLQFI